MSMTDSRVDKGDVVGLSAQEKGYKLYSALKYVPVALFCAFAILAFAAFAMPLASYNSVNSGIDVGAPGNIYTASRSLLGIDEHVRNISVVFLPSAAIAIVYAVFSIVTCINGKYGRRNDDDRVGATFAGAVCSGFYITYILFAVLAVSMLCRIVENDGGNGIIKIGSSMIVILASEIAFAVISAICEAARYRMEKSNGVLRATEQRVHAGK